MATRQPVSVRMSDIPWNQWLRIVLIKPSECRNLFIPNKGSYVAYKAYFVNDHIKKTKVFDMVFPLKQFQRAINAVPMSMREDLDRPVKFEFMKVKRSIHIRNWEVL